MKKGKGASTPTIILSPRKRRRIARERRAEEARWRSLNGPVRIYFDPSRLDKKSGDP